MQGYLFAFGVVDKVREQHILNLKATLKRDTEWKLGYIRAFFLDWYDKGISGVEKNAVSLLVSVKLKGTERGKAVATGCPYSGAYTFEEQVAFINWYVDAYTQKLISLEEYAFIMALQQTGARPIQLSYLYFGDLDIRIEEGIEHFDLNIPNAKKRHEGIRESFHHKGDISEDLMLVLSAKAKQSVQTIEKHLGIELNDDQKKIVPIFLRKKELSEVDNLDAFVKRTKLNPDYFCMRRSDYSDLVNRIARLCPLKTQRIMIDGEPSDLHINPRRFRYTHATNMAIMGASALAIAQELGHEDTQHVKVYTEFKEEIADRIDEALAPSLVPLAQAFSGTLIDSEKDAIRANDPRSRINSNKGKALGSCGEFGFCANGSTHCYTCNKFQPWLNAPHKEMLDSIMSDRDRKREMGASEFVLESHNRSINAIKVVIQLCEERQEESKNEGALDV
ncbi:site-specific integrase [Idiomarina baltica]|uniref:site-specific integrase n=1 Tax=Idiomarina baltica TaxID=190892 RepID=UPI002FDD42E6